MFKRIALIASTIAALILAILTGLSWAQSKSNEPLSVRFATPEDWPVFIDLSVSGAEITKQPILGGVEGDQVLGGGATLVRVPRRAEPGVAFEVIWSDYQTGEVYRASSTISKEDVARLYSESGMEMTVAIGPLGRLSIWSTPQGFREFAPGSPERRARLAAEPDLVNLRPVLRLCGTRFPAREAEFATFLKGQSETRYAGLIDPEIATRARSELGDCDPDRQSGL